MILISLLSAGVPCLVQNPTSTISIISQSFSSILSINPSSSLTSSPIIQQNMTSALTTSILSAGTQVPQITQVSAGLTTKISSQATSQQASTSALQSKSSIISQALISSPAIQSTTSSPVIQVSTSSHGSTSSSVDQSLHLSRQYTQSVLTQTADVLTTSPVPDTSPLSDAQQSAANGLITSARTMALTSFLLLLFIVIV